MKDSTSNFVKQSEMDIININNETAKMKFELDKIIDDQNALKAEAEEVRTKRLSKVSELAQILMAIDNIETNCFEGKGSGTKTTVKHYLPLENKPKNLYDDATQRVKYAKLQLVAIRNYLADYKEIHKNVIEQDKTIADYLNQMKDRNELI